ncbi:VWA domain-containing protein [Lysobacter sp. LF1]|uniref:VWA domain-containing protein n=1 Tax=Lysobacter stagni TaxID=3045172 RepID=A0ABT6XH90_9GAMM|nr:VWA domain-containing protein [Lysobacter sp. LF1]MDI9239416.1 VWA domain-containing protein [Lysobacter sp. LF1]
MNRTRSVGTRFAPALLFTAVLLALAGCRSTRSQAPEEPSVAETADAAADMLAVAPASAPPPPPPEGYAVPQAKMARSRMEAQRNLMPPPMQMAAPAPANTEKYAAREDNPVQRTAEHPVSTFSIDVDTGSYANVRRMIENGVRPPADSVRAEEFINYFQYGHAAPTTREVPFRVTTELAQAPWNAQRQVLMIGIKGYEVPKATLPPANLVFLLDTSGSMDSPDKLPLVKGALRQLVSQLRPQDRVSIVVYAGSAGLVLPPTPGDHRGEILAALDRLQAGGSTNGGDGIRLAYAMAKQAFVPGGANRVILATDGDFNVGTVDENALETLVADQRKSGIALTTLGFGTGNYNDELSERLADVGDGNHAYIDNLREAHKVLVRQMGGTLLTIARDVKIQIEFNPAQVAEYRLIGYENRILNREDFANDKVDAGDIGAGHEVTALYEITPTSSAAQRMAPLRYATVPSTPADAAREVAHLRLRYKRPGSQSSQLIETPVLASQATTTPSESLRFASAVAGFADALRGGARMDGWNWDAIARTAKQARGDDAEGDRAQFLQLLEVARRQLEADEPPRVGVAR